MALSERLAEVLQDLTGVRASKSRFYAEYRDTSDSLHRSIRALEAISHALTATTSGPKVVARVVLEAVGDVLHPEWAVLSAGSAFLPHAPRVAVRRPDGGVAYDAAGVPVPLLSALDAVLTTAPLDSSPGPLDAALPRSLVVPMVTGGAVVGALGAWQPREAGLGQADFSILQILANQTAVALQNSILYQQSEVLRRRTTALYEESARHAAQLSQSNDELRVTRRQLLDARTVQAVTAERHRIARELHDSVAQHVLSAGMQVEWCRTHAAAPEVEQRLEKTKGLLRDAVERIRASIFALSPPGTAAGLPAMLRELASDQGSPAVIVRVVGPLEPLASEVEHALFRIASEAVFNAVSHAKAGQVAVRLRYAPTRLLLTVEDDGCGDPAAMRRCLSMSAACDLGGLHRGLANMADRADEVGGVLRIGRARGGGVRVSVELPLTPQA